MPTPKLLPCPLCGGRLTGPRKGYKWIWWPSSCEDCECVILVQAPSLTRAIEKLNRRPSDEP
jgi:hypothetical protein